VPIVESLNRISTFSFLAWSFFFIAAVCAILLTSLHSPLIRRYRKTLLAVAGSSLVLGSGIWFAPLFISRLNPDQSRLTPIDELVRTEWLEPVGNPETEVPDEEVAWAKGLGYQFKYKLRFGYELQRPLPSGPESLLLLDQAGNLHGFDAYSGLNHWVLRLGLNRLLDFVRDSKKLYLLERSLSGSAVRISCVDYLNPALLWSRTVPRSREGTLGLDPETHTLYLSGSEGGVWALKSKTGEILWKRPELFSKARVLSGGKHLLVFEPPVGGKAGAWVFLDPLSGRTLQRTPHVYPELREFLVPEGSRPGVKPVLGMVDAENSFLLNPADLSQAWTYRAEAKLRALAMGGEDRFLSLDASNLLELRGLSRHELLWQKKIQSADPSFLRVSPDLRVLVIPSENEGESRSLSFYAFDTGEYLGSAHTSEPLVDIHFLGDWVYLLSENHVWAFRKF
jgi:hypothetical protein